jgi:hypothetical protein
MDKRKLNYIIVGVVLFVALLFWLLSGGEGKQTEAGDTKNNPEPSYTSSRWLMNPKLGNKDPYGLYVFEQLLISSGKFTEFNEILYYNLMDSIVKTDDNVYMFVGNHFALTEDEVEQIMEAVKKGDELFLCAEIFPSYFAEYLLDKPDFSFYAEDSVIVSMGSDKYSMYFLHQKDTLTGLWRVFNTYPSNASPTSQINSSPNYLQFELGKGKVHWHQNIKAFQNFQLLRKEGYAYQKMIVQEIRNKKIQWLAYADYEPYYDDDWDEGTRTSFLTHVFANKELRWAFFIAMIGMFLFFVFSSKREQPIVPLNPETSMPGISFVDTIAGLYFANKDAKKIVALLRKNFYIAIQEHFFLDIQHRSSSKTLSVLAEKTKMPLKRIEELVNLLEAKGNVSSNQLVEIHGRLRMFYIESGVWKSWKQPDNTRYIHFYRDKTNGILFVGAGVVSLVAGFILLSYAIGTGVLLWPLGIALTYIGAQLLGKPVCSINNRKIIIPRIFGESKNIEKNAIYHLRITAEQVVIETKTEKHLIEITNVEPKARKKLIDLLYTFKSN